MIRGAPPSILSVCFCRIFCRYESILYKKIAFRFIVAFLVTCKYRIGILLRSPADSRSLRKKSPRNRFSHVFARSVGYSCNHRFWKPERRYYNRGFRSKPIRPITHHPSLLISIRTHQMHIRRTQMITSLSSS